MTSKPIALRPVNLWVCWTLHALKAAPFALLAAALLALVPAAARAAEPQPRIAVRLSYIRGHGAQNCPPEQALHDEVAIRMGYDPFTLDAPDRIVATLKRTARGSTATVERFSREGSPQWQPRTYEYPNYVDCAFLVRTMAVYISFRFLPPAVFPQTETPSPSAPVPPPTLPAPSSSAAPLASSPPPSPRRPPAPPSPGVPSRPFRIELSLSPLVAFGFAPRVAFAGMFHAGLQWPSFAIAVEARADAPASSSVDLLPSATIGTFMLGGSVVPCWRKAPFVTWPSVVVMACGVLTTAAVHGRLERLPATYEDVDIYVGTGPRVAVDLRLGGRFFGRLFGDALVSLKPAQARIGGVEVWRTDLFSGDVSAALFALF